MGSKMTSVGHAQNEISLRAAIVLAARHASRRAMRGMCIATRSKIFGDGLYTWASGPRLRQSRRHRFVRLSPCFRAERSRCRPIDAMNVNNFSRRAQVAPTGLSFLVKCKVPRKGSCLHAVLQPTEPTAAYLGIANNGEE